jgi:flagellar hook assembly protein FlgD
LNKRYFALLLLCSLIFLTICLLFAQQITNPAGVYVDQTRNADGTLTFTVRTVTYGGAYAPRNSGAIWITNSSNQFVKTLKVWANTYRWTLVRWLASSGNNTTGAITGASLNSHQLHTVTWNATNVAGALVPDGNYTVNVEFTEHNATTSNPGRYKTVSYSKSLSAVDLYPPNETNFTDMHLVWAPQPPANGTITGIVKNTQNVPISGAVITAGSQTAVTPANGIYSISLAPGTYIVSCSAANYQPQTLNNLVVNSTQSTYANFILSPVVSNSDETNTPSAYLSQNYPNPFKGSTSFIVHLDKAAQTTLSIYNSRGQQVKTLVNGLLPAGNHELSWDGKDEQGRKLPSGRYLTRLNAEKHIRTRFITILN